LPANEYAAGGSHIRSANETPPGPGAPRALAPLRLCIGAGLVLAFTPVLVGEAVPRSLVADNDQWESRAALNAYLLGTDRAEFEKAARSDAEHWFWESPSASYRCLTHSWGNMTKWSRTRIDLSPNLAFGTWRSRRTRPREAICARVGRCFSSDRTGKSGPEKNPAPEFVTKR
jgi:hypothetical protein